MSAIRTEEKTEIQSNSNSVKIVKQQAELIYDAMINLDQRISFCLVVSAAIIGSLLSTNIVVLCNVISIICYLLYGATWVLLIACNSMFFYSIIVYRCVRKEKKESDLLEPNYDTYDKKRHLLTKSVILLVASMICCFIFTMLKSFL